MAAGLAAGLTLDPVIDTTLTRPRLVRLLRRCALAVVISATVLSSVAKNLLCTQEEDGGEDDGGSGAPPPDPPVRHVRAAAMWLERVAAEAAGGAPRAELQPLAALTLEQAGASAPASACILAAASAEEGVRDLIGFFWARPWNNANQFN